MIAKCRSLRKNGNGLRTEDSSIDEKLDEIILIREQETETECNTTNVALLSHQRLNKNGQQRRIEEISSASSKKSGIRIGELSIGKVRTVEEARSFRKKYNISELNLALFPSSCAPPTLAHEKILNKVLDLPFVDQVWVDVNYKSYTKEGIEHMFNERLEMIKLVVANKKGYDYCTLSRDTNVGEEKDGEDTYFKVAKALVGTGVLSWVVGGDVIMNMVLWKTRAKANLLQVDRLVICTRGMTTEEIQDRLLIVLGSKEDLDLFSQRVRYIRTSADISSTVARESLGKILDVMSPEILTYIISHRHVLNQYCNEFRHAV